MLKRLSGYADINSHTPNTAGVARVAEAVGADFVTLLGVPAQRFDLPPYESINDDGKVVTTAVGPALLLRKRPSAPHRVLLNIHLDTVHPVDGPFQSCRLDGNRLNGPGVVDAKGGLVVLLEGLARFEAGPDADLLGWDVFLNPDEEIGSPASSPMLRELARQHSTALVYEPTHPDGVLVGDRKGSGTYSLVVRGMAVHAGRDFSAGRSATVALATAIQRAHALNATLGPPQGGVVINIGRISGGTSVNIVPDLAIARINVRASTNEEAVAIHKALTQIAVELSTTDGITAELHGGFTSPPKSLSSASRALTSSVLAQAALLGLPAGTRPSGGACDGNKLQAAGCAVVDTMGPVGGHLHTEQEYVLVDSLEQRSQLTHQTLSWLAHNLPPANT